MSAPASAPPSARRLASWLVVLAAMLAALCLLGRGPLATPPVAAPSLWGHWVAQTGPVAATMALLRLVALGIGLYLWLVTLLALLATCSSSIQLRRLAHALTVPFARRVMFGAAGVGLTVAVTLGPTAAAIAHPRVGGPARSRTALEVPLPSPPPAGDGHATERELPATPAPPSTTVVPTPHAADAPHEATEHELPSSSTTGPASSTTPSSTTRPASATAPVSATTRPAAPRASSTTARPAAQATPAPVVQAPATAPTWTVAPGDNFWFEAEHVLTHAWGRAPSDAEIVPYWHTLVAANRAALRDPANPDLIYPGQRFSVPAPPPAPR